VLTSEEIHQIVAESGQKIREKVLARIEEQTVSAIEGELRGAIAKEVQTFVAENVIPAVREQLAGEKPKLVEAAVRAAGPIADALTKALVARVEKTLENDYDASEILKKLISRY
jgi:vacuolar-type H+-ATPase subunit C/Vma6